MKILVAEDDVVLRRLLSTYLERWGHDVTHADNGEEAWRLFEAGDFSMVITDWMMPRMDGLELVRRIRASERLSYVYVIMLTAKAQKEDLIDGIEAGADDFITKPFDRDELRVRLRAGERILDLHRKLLVRDRMNTTRGKEILDVLKKRHPEKFAAEEAVFSHIHRGDRIFIGTGCGEPQYLVNALVRYVESHPKAIVDAEVFHVWTLGVAPYTEPKFKGNFRHNSFFVGGNTRDAVNAGLADYTPIFLSAVPKLFRRGLVAMDVALVQTSLPDCHGFFSLGISVDIVKAAVERATCVIAQVNANMPRTLGDSFLHIDEIDFVVPHDEPLLEYHPSVNDDVIQSIGRYISRLVEDGDTIQVGYGSIPNAILANLKDKKNLGVHSELLSDGIIDLMKLGVIDNSRKTLLRGKTVAAFCMGRRETYEYLDDNPDIEFRPIDFTNSPLNIARHDSMTAINMALEIDLTGQSTAESLGSSFFSGVGGQADFMRGAVMAGNGKSILALPSTAHDGEVSRIVPYLHPGAGVTLTRGDIHYVVTEFGIAHLFGKNVRERAMELIAVAHPRFRPWLIQEAKKYHLIYRDQAFIPGKKGEYPEELETVRTTRHGLEILLRPVKISDEPALKDFFYSLTDQSLYRRFISMRMDIPHERLQEFVVIDYTREIVILATVKTGEMEEVVAVGQYGIDGNSRTAEVALVVRDDYQNRGVGTRLLEYLTLLAKRQGLQGFTAEVLIENRPMLSLFEKSGFDIQRRSESGVFELRMLFKNTFAPPSGGDRFSA